MKKLIIISAIAMSGLIYNTADAQIGIHVGLHFGTGRVYAPEPVVVEQAPVYNDNDYYYLPDVDAYYSVNQQCYYYFDGDNWISAAFLPGAYRDYDWRTARRYEVRESRPYLRNDVYRTRYSGHEVNDWARRDYNSHFSGGYAVRNSGGYNQRFDGRGENHASQPSRSYGNQENQQRYTQPSNNNGYGRDNRGGGYAQPSNQNSGYGRGNRGGGYTQPSNQNSGQGRDNRGGGYTQPSNQNSGQGRDNRGGGNAQPSNQNGGGRGNNGQHAAQNTPQGGYGNQRMARF